MDLMALSNSVIPFCLTIILRIKPELIELIHRLAQRSLVTNKPYHHNRASHCSARLVLAYSKIIRFVVKLTCHVLDLSPLYVATIFQPAYCSDFDWSNQLEVIKICVN